MEKNKIVDGYEVITEMYDPLKSFYVYCYLDPRKKGHFCYINADGIEIRFSYEPFYIGKGKSNRLFDHLKSSSKHSLKNNKIKKIRSSGFQPIILLLKHDCFECDALEFEKSLISIVGRIDLTTGPLTNLTDGGDGILNVSNSTRKKMSISATGKKQSLETIEKRVSKLRGINRTINCRTKISSSLMGHEVSEQTRQKMRNKRTGIKTSLLTKEKMRQRMIEIGHTVPKEARLKAAKNRKKPIIDKFGTRFDSSLDVALHYNLSTSYICGMLKGRKFNHLGLFYAEKSGI